MLQFQLMRGGDRTKRYRNMNRRQRARFSSMGRKTTSAGGEVAPKKGKGGDSVSWADANLTGAKNKENTRGRFSWYKWTVKI
jgi:hypothetical protein